MAKALGKGLHEYLRNTLHREHLCWVDELDLELNEPDRADYYVMRAAQAWGGGQLSDYKVEFDVKRGPPKPPSPEQIKRMTIAAKMKWFPALGLPLDG